MSKRMQTKARIKGMNTKSAFHVHEQKDDDMFITAAFIREVKKTGQIRLAGCALTSIPQKIWTMYETEPTDISDRFDLSRQADEEAWWNIKPLVSVDLSSNVITEISSNIQQLQDLTNLNLHDNNISTLPSEIGEVVNLTKLDLSRNKLTSFPDSFFKLIELGVLNVSHNNLETISPRFSDLIMLEILDLSCNQIISLPSGMGFLIRLVDLNISHNNLTELPADIVNLRDLRKLDLTDNQLECLPDMGELRKLEFLYVQKNQLIEIPEMKGCLNLREIYFANNNIEKVPLEFCEQMPHLKILDLQDNRLEVLPFEISLMQQLTRLNLQNNSLTFLPNALCLLPHLTNLQVDGNMFRSLRRDIVQCGTSRILQFLRDRYEGQQNTEGNATNVPGENPSDVLFPDRYKMKLSRSLNVANKDLSVIPDSVFEDALQVGVHTVDICKNKFAKVPERLSILYKNITELNMSTMKLTELPDFISSFENLKFLDVSKNCISDLPISFSKLQNLQELILSTNRFERVPEFIYHIENLETLLIRENQIEVIDAENLLKLKRLAVLDMGNNNISAVPPQLGLMKQLRTLELNGNSFRQPRCAILAKGTEEILSYLRTKIPY